MRLAKRDVERLWQAYDEDPEAALATALAVALDAPGLTFDDLVALASFDPARAAALLTRDQSALDELARELNELRDLAPR